MKKATLCYIYRKSPQAAASVSASSTGGVADGTVGGAAGREYLMLYRNKKKDDPNEGKWIGVGGKFEPGETADECMLREVREETGLATEPAYFRYHFCGVIHFLSDRWEDEDMYLYRAEYAPADPAALTDLADPAAPTDPSTPTAPADPNAPALPACEEGELRWIPEDELMDLPMWEGDRLFLKPLLEGAEEISMTLQYEGDRLVQSIYR